MRLEFGVNTICRHCNGKGGGCSGCGGVGFTQPPPTTDDENSQAAADSIEPVAGRMRQEVLAVIRDRGPITTDAIERLMGRSHQSVSARVYELHRDGLVRRVGKEPTASGRSAWLYRVDDQA